jgi:hypothetical protein
MLAVITVTLLMILATTLVVAAHGVDTEREKLNKRLNPKPGMGRRRKK